ncbi:MAG: amidohydrolase family protein [Clostridia bacterium]|nr:amidohydrolase family protein [Clostridia bacterium]
MALDFFDCNCCIGRSAVTNPGSFYATDELVSRMSDYGIGRALIYHTIARDHSPAEGNLLLSDITRDNPSLIPVWVVMPHHTGEFPAPDELEGQMRKNSVKAARIFPSAGRHNFSIKPYSAGSLLEMLAQNRIPLFIDIYETGWESIDMLLAAYRDLPVVLCNTGYRGDRYIYPLMETYGNVYLETSRYLSHLGIEALCKKEGSDRILFGSGMPVYTGAGAVFYISKLMLEDKDKQMIASGNLERLIGDIRL